MHSKFEIISTHWGRFIVIEKYIQFLNIEHIEKIW